MAYKQTDHIVINKPLGISGKYLDARSGVYENGEYRDYDSVAEVITTLINPDDREGHFPIFITANGVTEEWWFKDGTTNAHLVKKASSGGGVTESQLTAAKARSNHTGTQSSSTISDFTEAVQDAVAAFLGAGSNVVVNYNDAANTLTISATGGGGGGLDAETVRDVIGVAIVGIGNIAVSYNDALDTITISTTATVNDTDANLKARANHTGTQAATTITEDSTHRFTTDAKQASWDAKQAALGFTPENVANKSTDSALGNSTTLYPVQKAVKDYVDAHAVTGGGYLPKLSTSGTDSAALTSALSTANELDIDVSPTLNSDVTVPYGKTLNVREGSVISGTGKLTIAGGFTAGNVRVFSDTMNVKFTEQATRIRKPEWFGAKPMVNFRDLVIDPTNSPDCLLAFQRGLLSGDSVNFPGQNKNFVIHFDVSGGAYALSDTLVVEAKTANFVGISQAFGGNSIKYVGTMTTANATKAVISLDGCNYSAFEKLAINATMTPDDTKLMLAGVQMFWSPELLYPQRRITFGHVVIGTPIGNENVQNGWEFRHGILVGKGSVAADTPNGNNDFFSYYDLNIGKCKFCITIGYDQAVDHLFQQLVLDYSEVGISYPKGGSFMANSIYFGRGMSKGCIKGPESLSNTFRFEINNCSSEHQICEYFLHSDGPTIMKVTGGFIGPEFDLAAIPGFFKLITGNCMTVWGQFEFERIVFFPEGVGKMYIDCIGNTTAVRHVLFKDCSGAESLYLKFPNTNTVADATWITFDGRVCAGGVDRRQKIQKLCHIGNPHCTYDATNDCWWLLLSDLFADGSSDTGVPILDKGDRLYQPITREIKDSRKCFTKASSTLRAVGMLPANQWIKAVVVTLVDNGVLPSGGHIDVGDGTNDTKFGTITGSGSGLVNSIFPTGGIVYTTTKDIVLKLYNSSNALVNFPVDKLVSIMVEREQYNQFVNEIAYNATLLLPEIDLATS